MTKAEAEYRIAKEFFKIRQIVEDYCESIGANKNKVSVACNGTLADDYIDLKVYEYFRDTEKAGKDYIDFNYFRSKDITHYIREVAEQEGYEDVV